MISLEDCKVEKMGSTRTYYTFNGLTPRGESVIVGMTACHPDNGYKNSLPNIWYRHGFISYVLPSYWTVDVYVYDECGCWGRYNPTEKLHESGKRMVLDFDWMLPATNENRDKILAEIIRRANKED